MLSMVIYNFHIVRVRALPAETDAPLKITPNTILARPVAFQGFEPIARRHGQISNCGGRMQLQKLAPCRALNIRRKAAGKFSVKNLLCLRASEALNHYVQA